MKTKRAVSYFRGDVKEISQTLPVTNPPVQQAEEF